MVQATEPEIDLLLFECELRLTMLELDLAARAEFTWRAQAPVTGDLVGFSGLDELAV